MVINHILEARVAVMGVSAMEHFYKINNKGITLLFVVWLTLARQETVRFLFFPHNIWKRKGTGRSSFKFDKIFDAACDWLIIIIRTNNNNNNNFTKCIIIIIMYSA